MGAGFGGSVIALADADATSDLSRSVSAAFEARFSRAPRIMAATASAGASEIAP
jgi:galactokinase